MKTPSRFLMRAVFVATLSCSPASALASVQITEIMYDVPGTDTGREWVEITNTGSSAVDVSGYKFFEANTNHGFTVASGNAILAPGSSAVIIEDATKFGIDWPAFSGTLLKSSFSLSNTGETIQLKDSSLVVIDTATYDGSMGAAGDGNSLHVNGTTFVTGAADPGTYTGGSTPPAVTPPSSTPASSTPPPASTQSTSAAASNIGSETLSAKIKTPQVVMVGGGSFFSGSAADQRGSTVPGVRCIWNFGDGATAEGQTVFHTYAYPGKYAVGLTVASGDEAGVGRMTVTAVPAQIGVLAEPDGSLLLLNQASQDVNIGLWSISSGTSTFPIPQDTIILGGQSIRFSTATMHMYAGADSIIRYANGASVATAVPHEESAPAPLPTSVASPYIPTKIYAAPAKTKSIATTTVPTVAAVAASGAGVPVWTYALGAGGLVLIGIAGSTYIRPFSKKVALGDGSEETNLDADEFEIEG